MPGPQWGPPQSQGDADTINNVLWQQGQQPNSYQGQPQPQGYEINNQYFQPANTQHFGATPETIYGGGQIGAPDPNAVAASMNQIMARKAPTLDAVDLSGMGQTQASQMGLLDKLRGYAQGLGPSAAQIGSTMGMGQAAAAGRAGMAGGNALAARAALGMSGNGMNAAAQQGASARSQETGQMMGALGSGAQGLAQNALGVQGLTNQQIQQQQALGLGQATRNYQLAQGMLGTSLQEQMDIGKAGMQNYELQKQKQQFDTDQAIKYAGSAIPFVGGMFTAAGLSGTDAGDNSNYAGGNWTGNGSK